MSQKVSPQAGCPTSQGQCTEKQGVAAFMVVFGRKGQQPSPLLKMVAFGLGSSRIWGLGVLRKIGWRVLEGSWVVITRVRGTLNQVISSNYSKPLLLTPLLATHEPPSRQKGPGISLATWVTSLEKHSTSASRSPRLEDSDRFSGGLL